MIHVLLAVAAPILAAPGAPTALTCEYQTDPIGIDVAAPRLSWQVTDTSRRARQTGYQVIVAASSGDLNRDRGTLWDTGKVESDQSIQLVYGGSPLASRARCWWKVRTWSPSGVSPWSRPASFEMGLLDDSDWSAEWITMGTGDVTPPLGAWIWGPDRQEYQTIELRKRFRIDGEIEAAKLSAAADNTLVATINGKMVGRNDDWHGLATFDVAAALVTGENEIVVEAGNEDGPAGLVAGLRVMLKDGSEVTVVSDDSWSVGDQKAVVIAKYGDAPWGRHGESSGQALRVRKEADLKPGIASARAYVTGLGLYELRINGEKVGEDTMTPGWTHFGKRVQYQTYDVTGLVHGGVNAVAAELGHGWFSGRINKHAVPEGGTNLSRFLMQLEVTYKDGSTDVVATDPTWTSHLSPITADDIYDGEHYDAQAETPGWDEPGFDAAEWSATRVLDEPIGRLVAQAGPTLKVTAELPVETVTEPTEGVYVFDFGQNASGRCRLTVRGAKAGDEIRIRHAEVLNPDGTIYTDNYRSAKVTDVYACKGDPVEVWEPKFIYRGFRYAEITGYPGEPPTDALVHCVLHSAPDWAGEFACSNDLINRFQQNIRWGQISNMHSVPTDCPQRDERLGWTGDALIFAQTMCWNMDMSRFFTKWMHDIIDSQGPNGETSDIAPVEGPHGPASPGWGDVVMTVPWNVYQFYGDTRIIEQNYEGMKAWVDLMHGMAPNLLYEREGYGDWVAVVGSPKKPIGAAYFYYSTAHLARMAKAIGRDDDAREYSALADGIADAFNKAYLNADDPDYPGGTQTANILPLAFGIVPESAQDAIAENIADDVKARENHLSTGFLGTSYLMPTLSKHGYHELAYTLADQRTYPSWGYMLEKGATTVWELWNSDTQGPGMNSRNHYAFGSVGQWYYEYLAGIQPLEPGFKRILIAPQPAGDLTWAEATYPSLYGDIQSSWRLKGGSLRLSVTIPANTTAQIRIPALGSETPTVTESGVTLVDDGQAAGRSTGLRLVEIGGAVVFSARAGEYEFVLKP